MPNRWAKNTPDFCVLRVPPYKNLQKIFSTKEPALDGDKISQQKLLIFG